MNIFHVNEWRWITLKLPCSAAHPFQRGAFLSLSLCTAIKSTFNINCLQALRSALQGHTKQSLKCFLIPSAGAEHDWECFKCQTNVWAKDIWLKVAQRQSFAPLIKQLSPSHAHICNCRHHGLDCGPTTGLLLIYVMCARSATLSSLFVQNKTS